MELTDDARELLDGLRATCAGQRWEVATRVLIRVLGSAGMASDALDALDLHGEDAVEAEVQRAQAGEGRVLSVRPVRGGG